MQVILTTGSSVRCCMPMRSGSRQLPLHQLQHLCTAWTPSIPMLVSWNAAISNTRCCLLCHCPLPSIDEQMTTIQNLDHEKLLLSNPTRSCAIGPPAAGRTLSPGCQQSRFLIPKASQSPTICHKELCKFDADDCVHQEHLHFVMAPMPLSRSKRSCHRVCDLHALNDRTAQTAHGHAQITICRRH